MLLSLADKRNENCCHCKIITNEEQTGVMNEDNYTARLSVLAENGQAGSTPDSEPQRQESGKRNF